MATAKKTDTKKKTTNKKTTTKRIAPRREKVNKVYELILKDGSHHYTTKKTFDLFKLRSTEIISFDAHNGNFVGEMFVLKENVHCFVVYEEQQEEHHNKSLSFVKHK